MSGPDAITKAVGTGPFTYVEWQQGSYLRFARNKNYWLSGKPYLDEVEVDVTNDAPNLAVRLESGDAQAISDPPIQDLMRLKQDPSWVIRTPIPATTRWASIPTRRAPIPCCRTSVCARRCEPGGRSQALYRHGARRIPSEPWNPPWPSYSEAYEVAKQSVTAFDLDKAKSLLNSAGVDSAEVIVYRWTDGELAQFVQIYKADLATIGVNLTIKPLESALYSSVTNQRQYQLLGGELRRSPVSPQHGVLLRRGALLRRRGPGDGGRGLVRAGRGQAQVDVLNMNDFILDQSLDMVIGQTQRALVFPKSVHGLDRRINQVTYYTETWLQS